MAHADPNVTGLSLDRGDLGSYVTIYGTGFGETMGQSYVLLGEQQLPVLAWSDLAISIYLMPRNASTLQRNVPLPLVVVQEPGNKKSAAIEFTVTGPVDTTTPGDSTGTTTGGTTGTDTGTTTGDTTPAAADVQALNDALLVERVAAQFYNQNITKPYLTTTATTPDTTTGGTTTPDTTTGGTTTGDTTGGATTGTTGTDTTTGTTAGDTTTGTTTGGSSTADSTGGTLGPFQDTTAAETNLAALRSMVDEIRANHQAHTQQLEQALGTNTQPVPTFRNLDAPTLQQFLEMAQAIEDWAVGAHTGLISTVQDGTFLATIAAMLAVDARHAGAIRAYRKVVGTAEGGDPNLVLSPNGALEQPLTREQLLAFAQQYLDDTSTTPDAGTGDTGTGTGDGTGTGNGTL
jgi:hypothetical protein